MIKKRLLSILLSCCMMLTLLPTAVFAEGGGAEATRCVCETACTAEQMNTDCPVCGSADAAPENCGKYISPEGGNADWENDNNNPVVGAISPEGETGDSESPPEQDKEEYEAVLILGDTVTNYQTVTDAMTAAQKDENSGCTVKLLKNVTLTQTLLVKKGTLTLDLAGFYLAGRFGESRATLRLEKESTADLTIMDTRSETGTGYIENSTSWGDSSAVLAGGGKLTIESGRFLNGLQVDDKAQVKINGGVFVRIRPYNYEWGANAGGFTVKVTDGRQVHDLLREGCELYYEKEDRFVNCRVAKMQFEEELILRAHPKHNSDENGKCDCGFICPHKEFQDGVCTSCGTGAFLMLTDSTGAETKYFVTLSDAFNAVPKKSDTDTVYTVTVLASRKLDTDWITVSGKRVTLDLGGQTLSRCWIHLKDGAELTLTGSGAMNDGSHIEVYGECKLYVKNGTVDSVSVLSATSGSNGTVYLQGGTIGLTLRLSGDAVLTGGTLTSLSQVDTTAMGMAESVLLGDILPEGYALEYADDPAEKLPRSTGIKKNASLRRTMHVVCCDHGGENAIQDNRCIYCGVEDPFNYDLAKGSIEITVDETGAQTVKQGERITPHTGAVTITQSGSDTPTTQYGITVTAAAGQTASIILSGVNIDLSATGSYRKSPYSLGTAAMATYGGGNVTVELDGVNCLISGAFRAGLEKHNAGMLTINDSNAVPGSLRALGCFGGAGIGGITGYIERLQDERVTLANANAENITINGGTIEAYPYFEGTNITGGNGAGIGGGYGGNAKNITINGGTIIASSGQGAGIGSGAGGVNREGGATQSIVFHAEADNIVINGGEVTATTVSGSAGIGGGFLCTGKNITVNNGKVTATGNEGGAGIGGGAYYRYEKVDNGNGNGENITINGGEVIASGGTYRDGSKVYYGGGAGIGGGGHRDGKNIKITGGKVTATGGACKNSGGGAGIGGGGGSNDYGSCSGSDITITGGEVFATGGAGNENDYSREYTGGAGIGGGGFKSNSGEKTAGTGTDISISNATITAVGAVGGAGIGGGSCSSGSAPAGGSTGKDITIENCTVNASSARHGAGIGGGHGGSGENITIKNCKEITATAIGGGAGIGGGYYGNGKDITIESCEKITATTNSYGAGIGGGYYCSGENITIENCNSVNAIGYWGAAIGGGKYGDGRNILIQNSEVTATCSGGWGAGIGGGESGNGEVITITDSKVTANTCGEYTSYGAGIGGGGVNSDLFNNDYDKAYGIGRRITIQNSEVIATASSGAGIGGGGVYCRHSETTKPPDISLGWGNGEDITIINSTVTATGEQGAGIGGGMSFSDGLPRRGWARYDGKGRNITIESGTVTAQSNYGGAGIGGGASGDAENITINGGIVTATASYIDSSSRGGAGIGGGSGIIGGNAKGITINGGTVIATGGGRRGPVNGYAVYVGGAGIGGGGSASYGGGDAEDITVNGGTVIATGGPNAAGIGGGACSATPDSSTHRYYPIFSEEEEGTWIPRLRAGCVKNITINGGTVTAIGQDKASGIGGGGFHTKYDEDNQFGENTYSGHGNPQRAAGCAENITINGGYLTVQGGQYGADIGRSEFSFKGRVSTESGLTVTGGTFYRSIPANVEVSGHVVEYQASETVSAWQVVQHGGLAYLPRLTDENGVSLDEWYRENEKSNFAAPVTAGMTLTAQAHTYGDWTVTKEPTAARVGEKQRTCTDCGHVQTTEIPALETPGHVCVYDRETVTPDALKTAADCTHDAVYYKSCACGILSSTETFTAEGTRLGHDWAADWCHDTQQHWHECTRCHTQKDKASHTGNPCDDCGYNRDSEHTHTRGTPVTAKAATCTEAGNKAYYTCTGCDGWFEDKACTMQISKKLDVFLAPIGHKVADNRWQASENTHWKTCACGLVADYAAHVYDDGSDTTCNVCGYVRTIAPTTYTVTFDANGGSSNMDNVTGVSGAYTLPSCGFTAPTDKEFKAWSIGGVEYNPGDSITVSSNITLTAIWKDKQITPPTPATYMVRFDANGGSVSPASMTTGTDGKLASLPTPIRSSYSFDGWYTEKSGGTKVTTETVFKKETTVYAHWTYTGGSGGDSGYTYYTLTFETNGGSTIFGERFRSGTMVDLTKYTPTYKGYTFTGWYSDKGLTDKITSVKLDGNKTVYAGWRVEQNPQTGANPFTDVSKSDWFYDDVMFVYEKSLMVGTSNTLFSPYGTAARAMMATILWRMEGSPAPKNAPDFTDVASGKWYSDAIAWTTENGIYQGYGNGAFKPDDPITREQLAAIFYRYADYKGYDMTVKGSLDKFKDKDRVSTWAQDAMQWAVGSGLIQGKTGSVLDPQGTATRAEIAAMLHRFIEKYGLVEGKAPGGMTGWIDPKRLKIPQTGDASTLGLWSFTLCASLAGCLALTTAQLRRKREEEALQIIEK